jgi:hypothetical protein
MSAARKTSMAGKSPAMTITAGIHSMPYRRRVQWALVSLACVALLVAPAAWNGFPLLQYDTGGYLAPWYEHQLHISRSVPYGLLLAAGHWLDFWPVLIVQSALTVWVLALVLRVHKFAGPRMLLGVTAALCLTTTLPWLTAILLTDIFAGLAVLALYLLLLHAKALARGERAGLFALTAAGAATHSATLAVLILLLAAAALFGRKRIAPARLAAAALALVVSAVAVFAADYSVTGKLIWTPGGPALSFGRMLEDGIVKRYLDDHCPGAGLKLCPYKDELAEDADDFFWGGGVFDKLGRFDGLNDEMRRIALASLADYPVRQLASMISETAQQLTEVETGAGVVNWVWNTYDTIKAHVPAAAPAMQAARQQRGGMSFERINAVQVPVALLCMALLLPLAFLALRAKEYVDLGVLNAAAALTVLANAAVFGVLATAHNRYGARIVWLAVLAVLLTGIRLLMRRAPRLAGPKS